MNIILQGPGSGLNARVNVDFSFSKVRFTLQILFQFSVDVDSIVI